MGSPTYLEVKDGNGSSQHIQANTGTSGLVNNIAATSVATETTEYKYSIPSDFTWSDSNKGAIHVLGASLDRRGVIIHNSSTNAGCYILLNSNSYDSRKGFGDITDGEAPQNYTFMLDAGGTYFGDTMTSGLSHGIYVASGSNLSGVVSVTEIS